MRPVIIDLFPENLSPTFRRLSPRSRRARVEARQRSALPVNALLQLRRRRARPSSVRAVPYRTVPHPSICARRQNVLGIVADALVLSRLCCSLARLPLPWRQIVAYQSTLPAAQITTKAHHQTHTTVKLDVAVASYRSASSLQSNGNC